MYKLTILKLKIKIELQEHLNLKKLKFKCQLIKVNKWRQRDNA